MTEAPRGSRGNGALALGLTLFAAAIAVRLPGLERCLFYDELFTAKSFADSLAHALLGQKQANNHPLCSLLAWASTALLGRNDALALRAPSVLVGAIAVVATAWLSERRSTRTVGALAGTFALVHPAHVGFSQEVRGYALVLLFAPLAVRLALDVLEGERRLVGLLAACVALGVWAHATFGAVAVGLVAYLLFCKDVARADRKRALVGVGGGLLLGGVLLSPTLSHLGKFAQDHTNLGDGTGGFPTPGRVGAVVEMLSVGDARLGPFWLLAVGLGTLAVVGSVASLRARDRLGAAISFVLGATAILWVVARPLFHARFFAFLLPMVLVLAARGASELAARVLGQEKRALVFLVGAPVVLGWAMATGERAGWETQPTGPALEFAYERADEVGLVGLGSDLVAVDPFRTRAFLPGAPKKTRIEDIDVAEVELFPERDPDRHRILESYGFSVETRDFPGLYSPVRVHLRRGRPH